MDELLFMDVASWINPALLHLSILFPQELFQGRDGDGVAIETPDSSTDLWGTPLFSSFVQRTKCCTNLAFRCCSRMGGMLSCCIAGCRGGIQDHACKCGRNPGTGRSLAATQQCNCLLCCAFTCARYTLSIRSG